MSDPPQPPIPAAGAQPGRRALSLPAYGGLLAVLLAFATWFGFAARDWPVERERLWIRMTLAVLAVVAALALGAGVRRRATRAASAVPLATLRTLALDAALVTAWSFAVRFGLTTLGLLTDGGSGFGRYFGWVPGFQGLATLSLLLFDVTDPWGAMRGAMMLAATLAALGPLATLLLARSLGAERRTALVSGFVVASIPAHAVLFTSDFLSAPLATLGTLAVAAVAASQRRGGTLLLAFGAALASYTVWGRPEASLILVPLLLVGWRHLLWARHARWMLLPLFWFALNVAAAALHSLNGERIPVSPNFGVHTLERILVVAWERPATVPLWMWAGGLLFPLAALTRARRRRAALLVAAATISAAPAVTSWALADRTLGYTELFRYGVWALPWMAIMVATGWDAALRVAERAAPSPRPRALAASALTMALLGWFVATPLAARDYLARVHSHDAERPVFLALRAEVPAGCALFVMDDDSHHSVAERFQWDSGNPMLTFGRVPLRPPAVAGSNYFFEELARAGGELPDAAHFSGVAGSRCWYYYRAPRCDHGAFGEPEAICADIEARLVLEPAAERFFDLVHPRLSTMVDLPEGSAFVNPHQRAALYRVAGVRRDAALPPSPPTPPD